MKTLISSLALLISLQIAAQPLLKTKTSSSVQPALNEVIQDYFKHFEGILGDTLSHSRGTITFESRVKLPGAISCVVSKYATPATYSWEAIMSEDEDFDSAQKKYDRYFKELNNAKFAPNGFEKYTLQGVYDAPDETRGFASCLLKFEGMQNPWQHFTVDLGMQYLFPNWVVKISLYDKLPDEEIRPGMKTLR